ncbi:MAG: ribonuclease D [Deltaproteobacteria bacterium]|nr:ribonuclease D [Deltaproteobacteria bacterium]
MNNTTPNFRIIDTSSGLKNIVTELDGWKTLAVDLEADSMYHFKEKVCLLQMATEHTWLVIDPLAVGDLSPLKPIFSNPSVTKIFHGADYDIRSLYRDFKIEINNLFDTEIACRFLGLRESGLNAVLGKWFNIHLDKKFQRKDWSQRPLPKAMLTYGAEDVKHLIPLREIMVRELDQKNRLAWVDEECTLLSRVRPPENNNQPLYLKFKGAGRLKGRSLAVLENLLQLRKSIAAKKDRPLFKILGNESLVKMAVARPLTLKGLANMRALSKRQMDMYGKELLDTIEAGLRIPEKDFPLYPRKKSQPLSDAVPVRIMALKKWRDDCAISLELDPGLICNKSLMTAIAVNHPLDIKALDTIAEMKNWQRKEFGHRIIEVMKKVR